MDLPPFANLAFEFSSYALALAVFVKVLREDRFQLFLFLASIAATIAAEVLGMRVSHGYYYSDFLIKIAGMPLCIALDWAAIVFCIWRLGMRLDVKWYLLPLVFGVLAVPLDLALDPVAALSKVVSQPFTQCEVGDTHFGAAQGLGYWVWCVSPMNAHLWFGVPLGNFIGWFMLVFGFTLSALIAQRRWKDDASVVRLLLTGIGVVLGTLLIEVATMSLFAKLEAMGLSSVLVLLGLLGAGVLVVLSSGNRRSSRTFDGWALAAWGCVSAMCLVAYSTSLRGVVDAEFIAAGLAMLLFFVVLALWVMRGWPSSR